jgi:hypothetical protein
VGPLRNERQHAELDDSAASLRQPAAALHTSSVLQGTLHRTVVYA